MIGHLPERSETLHLHPRNLMAGTRKIHYGHEAYLPAQQAQAHQQARFPQADGIRRRP